ncbi:MAG: YbaB/EbfC family nucleoid-associated protein [Bacteroidota bacterium]
MFGNLEEQQQQMEEKLRAVVVYGSAGDGAVKVTANAAQDVTDISIDASKIDTSDTDQLEDLVLLAVQEALNNAKEKAAAASQDMINQMLPGGLGSLGSLFGK